MAGALLSLPAAGAVVSDFETGLDGWTDAGGDASSLTWLSTGGNPGGNLRLAEPASGGIDRFGAPAKFLGNQLAMYGGLLSYDMRINRTATSNLPDVLLLGGGLQLQYTFPTNPTGTFANFAVSLEETAGWELSTGGAPTQAEFQSVLGNLSGLQLSAEWTTSPDTTWIDNVALVPEPSSLAMLGLAALGLLRRHR